MSDTPEAPRLATNSIQGTRPYQEDAVLSDTLSDGRILVAVADGMGGHAAGDVASATALEALQESLEAGEALDEAFRIANRKVRTKAKEPGKQGMGTTLVAMLLDGDSYQVANVGDSRGYRITADGIERVTKDHSFVEEAIDRGQSEEEATQSEWKDALTRSIGTDEKVEVDVFGPFEAESKMAILLCSDGLYKVMKDDELRDHFVSSGGPQGAAQSLVSKALEDGSDDNISVAIAEFGEVPRKRQEGTVEMQYEPPADLDPVTEEAREEAGVAAGGGPDDASDSADAEPTETATEAATTADVPPKEVTAPSAGGGFPTALVVGAVVVVVAVILAVVLLGG